MPPTPAKPRLAAGWRAVLAVHGTRYAGQGASPRPLPAPGASAPHPRAACVAQRVLALAPLEEQGAPGYPSPTVPRGLGPATVVAPGTAVPGDSPEQQGLCWRKVMVMLVALSPPGVIPDGPCPALCSWTNCPGQVVAGKGPAGAGRCCGG